MGRVFRQLLFSIANFRLRSLTLACFFAIASPLFFAGCSSDKSLFFEKCVGENPNCKDARAAIGTEGAISDIGLQPIAPGETLPQLKMRPARYGQEVKLDYVLKNTRLVPLRDFELSLSPGDENLTLVTDFDGGCGRVSLLLYNESCRFRLVFKPGEANLEQDVLIKFKTLLGADYEILSSLAQGLVLPDFTVNASDLDFGRHLVYASSPTPTDYVERDIEVVNHSPTDITNLSIQLGGGNSFSIVTGGAGYCTAGQTLTADGGSCKIKVRFRPETAGFKTATLTFIGSPQVTRTYKLMGEAVAVASPSSTVNFGSRQVSTSAITKKIQLKVPNSTGNPNAEICTYNLSGSSQISISSQTCTAQQAAGSLCDLTLQFTPDNQPGLHTANLAVSCDKRGGELNISISARSTQSPLLVDSTEIDFGDQLIGSTTTQTLTFTNATSSELSDFLRSISSDPSSGVRIVEDNCSNELDPVASCTVTIEYSPTQEGATLANLTGSVDGADEPTQVLLKGQGLSIYADQTLLDFGATLPTKDVLGEDVRITNPSTTQSATGCRFDFGTSAENGFAFESGSTCLDVTSLAPGESCILKPTFIAGLPVGTKQSNVALICDVGGTAQVTLKGETVESMTLVALPSTQIESKIRLVGITDEFTFQYMNMDTTLTAGSVAVSAPNIASPWSIENAGATDCSVISNLAPNAVCQVKLKYAPSAAFGAEQTGSTSGQIIVTADNANPAVASYSATAVKITASLSDYDFGTLPTGAASTSTAVFYIHNPSNVDEASGCSLTLSPPLHSVNSSCASTLPPNSVCQFQAQVPALAQSTQLNGTARMDCTVGGRAEINITGLVQKPPTLQWTGMGSFGTIDIGQSKVEVFTLAHTGDALDAPAVPQISFTSGSSDTFTIVSNNCTQPLAPGESCTVSIRYTPLDENPVSAQLQASNGSGAVYDTIALNGDGVDTANRLVPSATTINLGGRLIGMVINTDITVTNNAKAGAATGIMVGNPTSGPPWSLGASPDPCTNLNIGEDCVVRVTYSPVETGSTSGTITISAPNVTPDRAIHYSGTATKISSNTLSLDFGTVDLGTPKVHPTTVTITNPSSIDQASGCILNVDAPFNSQGSSCGATIAPGSSCSFQIELPSQGTEQVLSGKATYACAIGGTVSIDLAARIADLPDVNWDLTIFDFGEHDVGSGSVTQTFTLKNTGVVPAQVSAIELIGSSTQFTIISNSCSSTTLNSNDTCQVVVRFNPTQDTTATEGENVSLRATVLGGSETAYLDASITGTGTTMALAVDQDELNFAPRELGQAGAEEKTVILTNNGTRIAHLSYSDLSGTQFAHSGGTCGATLNPGASCELKISYSAAATPGTHSETFTITETFNGTSQTVDVALNGQTYPVPLLQGKDDGDNTNYVTSIAESDMTGPIDDARNIVQLPDSREVTFTIMNSAVGSSPLTDFTVTLSHKAGVAGTMTAVSDTCTGATLEGSETCTVKVSYTPTAIPETSTYSLKVAGKSSATGATHEFNVDNLIGNAFKPVQLTLASPLKVLFKVNASDQPDEWDKIYTLKNEGDRTAVLSFAFGGTDGSLFSLDSSIPNACNATLEGGATCDLRIVLDAPEVGTYTATLTANDSRDGASVTSNVHGATYDEFVVGDAQDGFEGDVVADQDRFYMVSRMRHPSFSAYDPVLFICSRTAKGAVGNCEKNDIRTLIGGNGINLAGDTANSGPRIQQSGKKIIIAVQNKDSDPPYNGHANGGTATVIICQKPTAGQLTLAPGSCYHFIVNSKVEVDDPLNDAPFRTGEYPGLAVSHDKVVLSTMSTNDQLLLLTVCSYDDSTDSTDATTLDVSSCKHEIVTQNKGSGWYTSLALNGNKAVIATYDEIDGTSMGRLRLSVCTIVFDNEISDCNSQIVDDETLDDGGLLYPGAYPSIVVSADQAYIVHQHGKLEKMRLRLTSCSIGANNSINGCFSQNVASGSAYGATPRIAISGDHLSGRLWISGVQHSNPTVTASASRVGVYSCALPLTPGGCSSVSHHFMQPENLGAGPVYSRSLWFDSIGKQLVIPFHAHGFYGYVRNLGILNLGLLDEI